jgi:hypothetical protein
VGPTQKFAGMIAVTAVLLFGVNVPISTAEPPANRAPKLFLPSKIKAEATSTSGASVSFTVTASDAEDGADLEPRCTIGDETATSPQLFPLGETEVDCIVTDSGGLSDSGDFTVTVQDTEAPVLFLAAPEGPVQATSASGASVAFTASANDVVDGDRPVSCRVGQQSIGSGHTFSIGQTTVTCSAEDLTGPKPNRVTGEFVVVVTAGQADTTGPTVSILVVDNTSDAATAGGWFNLERSGADGVAVTVHADDDVGVTSLSCRNGDDPVDLQSLPLVLEDGVHVIACAATDAAGNKGSDSRTFKIDQTRPVMKLDGPADGATYVLGAAPSPSCRVEDPTPSSGEVTGTTLGQSGGAAVPSGTVGELTASCHGATDGAGNVAEPVVHTYTVKFDWTGFFQPVDALPTLNRLKAGAAVPVKFALAGNEGLGILADGSPSSKQVGCSSASADLIETVLTASSSSLTFDAATQTYNYVWKTDKAWTGTCRELTLTLVDGKSYRANFQFTR